MALVSLLLFASVAGADEADRTEVGVVFELTDEHYFDELAPADHPVLRAEAATAIAAALNDKIRFLTFSTTGTVPYRLDVKLDRLEGSAAAGLPSDFVLFLSLTGPGVRAAPPPHIMFRDKEHYRDLFFSVEDLVNAITEAIRAAEHGPLVAVLKQVAIAEGGEFVTGPVGWRIARDRAEYCLDVNSRLMIWTAFPLGFDPPRDAFEAIVKESRVAGTLLSVVDPKINEGMVPYLSTLPASELRVEHVYVVQYLRQCREPNDVANVGFQP